MPSIVVRCTLPQLPVQDERARELFGVSTAALRSSWRCHAWTAVQLAVGRGVRVRVAVRRDRAPQPPTWILRSRGGTGLRPEAERRLGALLADWSWCESRWLGQVAQLSMRARELRRLTRRALRAPELRRLTRRALAAALDALAVAASLAGCRVDYVGGETSTDSTTWATSTSTSTDSESAGDCVELYGPCSTVDACCSGSCIVQGPGGACSADCATAEECDAGDGGTAPATCTSDGCVLACNLGGTCPPGMVCGGAACVWPEGEP